MNIIIKSVPQKQARKSPFIILNFIEIMYASRYFEIIIDRALENQGIAIGSS